VTQRGKIVGAFVPIEDLVTIQSLEDKRDVEIFHEALTHGEFDDWNEVKKRLLVDQELISDAIHDKVREKSRKITKKNPKKRSPQTHSSDRRSSRKSKT
jgi:hypothetical protein